MEQIALELEFLVIVDAVEDVGGDFEQLLDELFIGEVRGAGVDSSQHVGIATECLILELLVGVDLVALGFKDPAQGLGVHVVDVAFVELERIAVVLEYLVIVDL